jgi:hypothetical protein
LSRRRFWGLALGLGLLVGGGCLWGRFDDLKSETWVYKVDRDEEKTQGAFGYAVAAFPSTTGAKIVTSSGPPPSGLAVLTFDATGELTEFVGFDAEAPGIPSTVTPLVSEAFPESIAVIDGANFALGIPSCSPGKDCGTMGTKLITRHGSGLTTGGSVLASGPASANGNDTGKWLRAGRVNAGTDTDLVAVGVNAIVVVLEAGTGTPTTVTCEPGKEARGLAVGDIDGDGIDEIIVAYDAGDVQLFAYRLSDIQAASCGGGTSVNSLPWPDDAEIGVTIGDLNGTGRPEVVAGNVIFIDFDPTLANAKVTLAPPTGAADFGAKSVIANFDTAAGNELVIADPRAVIEGEGGAGRVHIFKLNGTTANEIATLWEPKPTEDLRFGRDLAVAPFVTPSGTTNLLVVGAKDQVYVYFKVLAAVPDPRGD